MAYNTEDFPSQQADAWSKVVGRMVDRPTEAALNGSVNGPGSSLEYTRYMRKALPDLLRKYGITTMLDAPCGDWTWMRTLDLTFLYSYIGMDVERRLIEANRLSTLSLKNVTFVCANLLTRKTFPRVDLILCRDFLAHLPNEYISQMLERFKASKSTYLLASNYPGASNVFHYKPEEYPWLGYLERPHDLRLNPFDLKQLDAISEQSPPGGVIAKKHELALFYLQ
jgi:SAM-dependent methyltransferase